MGVRVAVMGGLVLFALMLKTVVLPTFAINGYRPDVLVLVVVGVALLEGPDTGLRLGFAAGLAQDLVSGGEALVGVGALVMMVVGYAAGMSRPYIVVARRVGTVVVSGFMAAGATLGAGLAGRGLGLLQVAVGQVVGAALWVGLYSAVVSDPVVRATQAVMRQFPALSR